MVSRIVVLAPEALRGFLLIGTFRYRQVALRYIVQKLLIHARADAL